MTIKEFLSHLEGVEKVDKDIWKACCPLHSGSARRLSIGVNSHNRIALSCAEGCSSYKIVQAMGLTLKALSLNTDGEALKATSKPQTAPSKQLLTPMATVEAKEASYLISPYLPRGMLAIMGGVSGSGKTYLALSWAAAISNGQRLPFQSWATPAPGPGYVYYFTQENDPNTVIRPRLDLLGANLNNILIQYQDGKTTYDPLTMNDPRLELAAKEYPPSLVIFDPIQSYLGGGVDMSRAEQVRPTLDWLGDYAKRHQCSIVLISHMSKPGKAVYYQAQPAAGPDSGTEEGKG